MYDELYSDTAVYLDVEDIVNAVGNRDLKIKVFQHLPRTANVKKLRDQCIGVRFAV